MMGGKNGRPVALSRSLDITNFVRYRYTFCQFDGFGELKSDLDLDPDSGFLVNPDPDLDPGFTMSSNP